MRGDRQHDFMKESPLQETPGIVNGLGEAIYGTQTWRRMTQPPKPEPWYMKGIKAMTVLFVIAVIALLTVLTIAGLVIVVRTVF